MTQTDDKPHPKITARAELQGYIGIAIAFAVMLVMLFWPAGTIDWRRGWLFFSLFVALTVFALGWVRRENPELIAVRRKFQKGTKTWDAILAPLVMLAFAAILPVAALDDARFRWAPTPDWVTLVGYAMFTGGYLGTTWAQSVNRHFEASVRIQTDRGHKVIDTGPYARIRHPGYAFATLMSAGMALSLGSLVALVPVGLTAVLLAIRTLAEEAELRAGLPGYTDYAARVRYRWLPSVW
jgi:protein-S-isoprenylcysteine O-methyltransferase Ste14